MIDELLNGIGFQEIRQLACDIVDLNFMETIKVCFDEKNGREARKDEFFQKLKVFRDLCDAKKIILPKDDIRLYVEIIQPLVIAQIKRSA